MNEQQLAALKQALDDLILEYHMERSSFARRVDEIFEQALAAPVQEPVAMEAIYAAWHGAGVDIAGGDWSRFIGMLPTLYTTPPAAQRPWVGLTQEEIENCYGGGIDDFARAIEAKLKEKNIHRR